MAAIFAENACRERLGAPQEQEKGSNDKASDRTYGENQCDTVVALTRNDSRSVAYGAQIDSICIS
jgi:hypothetical protein